jgi:hypothetical protein
MNRETRTLIPSVRKNAKIRGADDLLMFVRENNGCLEWTRHKIGAYGKACYQGQYHLAHRLMWQFVYGAIPEGLCILHSCDNPPCININHLSLGTYTDNNRDKASKGRSHKSRAKPARKARKWSQTDEQAILGFREQGLTWFEIAKHFSVSMHAAHMKGRQLLRAIQNT